LIVIFGVASGFVEALVIRVVDVVADDMARSNDAVLLSALSSTNPRLNLVLVPSWFDDRWLVVGEIGSDEMSQRRTARMKIMARLARGKNERGGSGEKEGACTPNYLSGQAVSNMQIVGLAILIKQAYLR
jgi:hypothetical protein